MGSRLRGNLGGSGSGASRQDWAQKRNPKRAIVNGAFVDTESLDLYLSGDLITCLECLPDCKSLGHHLSRSHNMSPLEYKLKYNIPKGRSLRGVATRKLSAEACARQWIGADERREYMRQQAAVRLVPRGTNAPRTAQFNKGYEKTCPTCKKAFHAARKRTKFCSQVCCKQSPEETQRRKDIAKKGGAARALTAKKNIDNGRFE